MKKLLAAILFSMALNAPAVAGSILFDFENATPHTPLPVYPSTPLALTGDGLTANFSSSGGDGFSIQTLGTGTAGIMPTGFSGNCIFPSGINTSDLLISFSQTITDFSILYATFELATDSAATMRVTAYMNSTKVETSTQTALPPFTYPSATLSISAGQGFNNVVVHYDSPPPTGGDYTPIFMADNMQVTTLAPAVPEPMSLTLLGMGTLGVMAIAKLRRRPS
jgi:hypothetical protein